MADTGWLYATQAADDPSASGTTSSPYPWTEIDFTYQGELLNYPVLSSIYETLQWDNSTGGLAGYNFGSSGRTSGLLVAFPDLIAMAAEGGSLYGKTLQGIEVRVRRFDNRDSFPDAMKDAVLSLASFGAPVGDNKAKSSITWTHGANTDGAYGGPSDLWGTSYTMADLADEWFGMIFQFTGSSTSDIGQGRIKGFEIKVYYADAAGASCQVIAG